ncbi:MAG: class I SAM-dependent methyltransferase [bacterium]|nr:class I SAM-dependent methyltransferase [bacterium]
MFSLILMGVIMVTETSTALLISHGGSVMYDKTAHENRLRENAKDLVLPLEEELDLLDQLTKFELGRFLLQNRGLNGYWISYIILHGPKKKRLSPLENWFVHQAPVAKSTQERFKIFQQKLQGLLREEVTLMSLPCGTMEDLFRLNYNRVSSFHLIGVDLDETSLELAEENALDFGFSNVELIHRDAWQLGLHETCDVLVSNGLNIYEADDLRVVDLYRQFYNALKPGGVLITSFFTPPPALSKDSLWKDYDADDLKKQKAILGDILQVRWQTFRTEAQTRAQLEEAGFEVREIIYDSQGMFPTVVAEKISPPKGLRIVKSEPSSGNPLKTG